MTLEDDAPPGVSRFGGDPQVPAGFEWPTWRPYHPFRPGLVRHLSFVAQIDLVEAHAGELNLGLPDSGSLLFFSNHYEQEFEEIPLHGTWDLMLGCATGFWKDRDAWKVIHVPAGVPTATVPSPTRRVHPVRRLSPYRTWTWEPAPVATSEQPLDLARAELDDDMDEWTRQCLAASLGGDRLGIHRLGGHATATDDPPEWHARLLYEHGQSEAEPVDDLDRSGDAALDEAEWRLLLQIDTDLDADLTWGDLETLYFLGPQRAGAGVRIDPVLCMVR